MWAEIMYLFPLSLTPNGRQGFHLTECNVLRIPTLVSHLSANLQRKHARMKPPARWFSIGNHLVRV